MDWNSPTTKKHIAEAKAQGCELLGPGRKNQYYSYQLPCKHEQEVKLEAMRNGRFRCQTCLTDRLKDEADEQGCILVGSGKNRFYRVYRLSCRHEQEIRTYHMREGNFKCVTCLNKRLRAEAEAQGCELLGAGRNKNYCNYRLSCGHAQEVIPKHMKSGGYRCQKCLDNKRNEEAEAQGCVLIGPGRDRSFRIYCLPCGHEQEIQLGSVRSGEFQCRTCLDKKLREEAENYGCELTGEGKNRLYLTYRLSCGHLQQVGIGAMCVGSFRCQTCEEYSYTQPSNVYLLHVSVGPDQWLKLGYAKNVDYRTSQYGLPQDAEVSVLTIRPFDTGLEAVRFEKALHAKYRRKRRPAKQMANFHTIQGSNECYPVTMIDRLMEECRQDGVE